MECFLAFSADRAVRVGRVSCSFLFEISADHGSGRLSCMFFGDFGGPRGDREVCFAADLRDVSCTTPMSRGDICYFTNLVIVVPHKFRNLIIWISPNFHVYQCKYNTTQISEADIRDFSCSAQISGPDIRDFSCTAQFRGPVMDFSCTNKVRCPILGTSVICTTDVSGIGIGYFSRTK